MMKASSITYYISTRFWLLWLSTVVVLGCWLDTASAEDNSTEPSLAPSTPVPSGSPTLPREEIDVVWSIFAKPDEGYPDQTARVGDFAYFRFTGDSQDVNVHPSGTCNSTGSRRVRPLKDGTGAKYKFSEADYESGSVTFASSYPFSCDFFGMIITFNVTTQDEPFVDSTIVEPDDFWMIFIGVSQFFASIICWFLKTVVGFIGALTNFNW